MADLDIHILQENSLGKFARHVLSPATHAAMQSTVHQLISFDANANPILTTSLQLDNLEVLQPLKVSYASGAVDPIDGLVLGPPGAPEFGVSVTGGTGFQTMRMGEELVAGVGVARSANVFRWEKGASLLWKWASGQTPGVATSSLITAYSFIRSNSAISFGIGTESFGNSTHKCLGIGDGTAPTSSPTGGFVMWSEGGEPRFRTSGGKIRQLVRAQSHANATAETPTATHTLRMFDDGGTEYRVLAIAV